MYLSCIKTCGETCEEEDERPRSEMIVEDYHIPLWMGA